MDIESDAEVSEFPSDHSIVSTERNCIKTNEYPPDKICDVNKESVEQICVNRLRRKFAHSKNGVSKIANSKCKMPHIEINKTKESMCSQQETNKTLETHKQGTKSKLVSVERNKKDVGVIDTEVLPTTIEKAYSVGSRDVISSSIQDVEESTITGTSVDKHLVSSDNNESCSDAVCTTGHEDFDESDSLSDSTMLPPCSSLKICSGSSAGETSLQNSFQPAYRNIKPKPSNKASYQELLSFMNSDTEENDSESSFKTLANADCKQSRLKLRRIKKTTTKEDVDVVTSRKRKKSNYFKFPQKKTRIDRDGCSHENVSLVANCSRVFKKKANIPSSSIPADSYSDASGTDQAEDFSVDNKCIVLSDVDSEDSSVDRQLYKQKLELSIQKIRDVVQLNEEEMTYLVNKNEGYLRKIFQGKIYSWRHEDYKTGGIRRIDLTYQVHHGSFSEEQQEVVMQSLMLMFCATHSKYLDYVLKVMCPEALIKIQMDVCKTTHEETERNMKEFQKQRLNESQIVQPEFH
uniref:Suppressor protein SRP40-like n=1 Tax=Saccoglossus kowalevskii TaxID=10224 RepID=A0ABM0M0R7_SACKO|nr:PREDICTED: suppressor protein SRP40-like [Saccoglossus kowalevskii]